MIKTPPLFRLFLWQHRVLYLGPSPDNAIHRHHAAQFCVSLSGTLSVRESLKVAWRRHGGVFIPPEQSHQIDAHGSAVIALYLEPESTEYSAVLKANGLDAEGAIQPFSLGPSAISRLADVGGADATDDSVWADLRSVLAIESIDLADRGYDGRIERVVQAIRARLGKPHPAAELAKTVNLSTSRLRHLFKQQLGISIRRYIVWLRLREVINEALRGESLTNAAHAAGFSDAAHMSNAFRKMFGFAPSMLFAPKTPKEIHLFE